MHRFFYKIPYSMMEFIIAHALRSSHTSHASRDHRGARFMSSFLTKGYS